MLKNILNTNYVLGSRLTVIISRFVIIYILSNSLGISSFGINSFLMSILFISSLLGNLGFGYSNIYYLAKKEIELNKVLGSSISISLIFGVVVGISIQVLPLIFETMFDDIHGNWMIIVGLSIPILILHRLMTDIVNGLENFGLYYMSFSFDWVINGIFVVILFISDELTITTSILSFSVSKLIVVSLVLHHLLKKIHWKIQFSFRESIIQIKYGLPLYFRDFFNQINFRFVYLLIKHYYNSAALGSFALAVQSAEVLLYIPRAGFTLLFPKFSAYKGNKKELFKKIILKFSAIFVILLAFGFLSYPIVISLWFDPCYLKAVPIFRILIVGVLFLGILNILESYILGENLQKLTMISSAISAIILVILSIVFIPIYGEVAAAIISSFVYFIYLIISIIFMRKAVEK